MKLKSLNFKVQSIFIFLFVTLFIACTTKGIQKNNAATNAAKAVTLKIPNHPLQNEKDLDVLIQQIGDAQIVLLGEASHGTSEYYTWRTALSKRLIAEKGFDFIAVEGEWADSYRVNNFIKGPRQDSAAVIELLQQYNRWPTWMWGNYEVASLVSWLNKHNQNKSDSLKAGFYGLDVYCLWESMAELMPYLKKAEPAVQEAAQKVHKCFQPFNADAYQYAEAVAKASASCRGETTRLWRQLQKASDDAPQNEELFVMQQNALVAMNGESYYRTMVSSDAESWNIRDRHMAQTLKRLLNLHGSGAKAIVWEHNTHVGDARYTDMRQAGQTNVGELVRKEYGDDKVFIVGFGSYSGTVIASDKWGGTIQKMNMPAARPDSWEDILHRLSPVNKIIFSKDIQGDKTLSKWVDHRAIGVVYHPQLEQYGNYVPSILPKRYDAFIYLDKTTALHPLQNVVNNEPPDTYPWGY